MIAARAGRIVNIASTAGQKGYAYCTAYAAAKHGVLGLTRSLALEVAAQGIASTPCAPATPTRPSCATASPASWRPPAATRPTRWRRSRRRVRCKRLVEPDEVAATVRWLCADAPAAFTGQAMSVSGGEVMN